MKLRARLILAFLFLSFLPLTAIVLYSYITSERAFRKAVEAEAGALAEDMGKRMESVTGDLHKRIDRLAALPFRRILAKNLRMVDPKADVEVAQMLTDIGEAAGLVESIEFIPAHPHLAAIPRDPGKDHASVPAEGSPGAEQEPPDRVVIHLPHVTRETPEGEREQSFPRAQAPQPREAGRERQRAEAARDRRRAAREAQEAREQAARAALEEMEKKIQLLGKMIDVHASTSEAERSALEGKRQEMKRIFGREFKTLVRREGEMVGTMMAQVRSQQVLQSVIARTRRHRGEIPFARDAQGGIHTARPEDKQKLETIPLDAQSAGSSPAQKSDLTNWIVVSRKDPESGLTFGIARPIRESLQEIRRTAVRNLGYGLGMVGLALLGILPLSGRLTRNLTRLTQGAEELARGNLDARVPVRSKDELGQLAATFNRMAEQLGENQVRLLEQERLRKELELCRKIQEELLPREPLRLGMAEVRGISIPARELGGDFFNYFPLPGGEVGLLIGDVSGKGVPAALLMANLQAMLRARLPLETHLARLARLLDREIEATTPPELYLTLFIAILDPRRHSLRYVNAGHNTQFALRAGGVLEPLESTGRPLGLLPGGGYEERQINLGEGDSLFLYSDGLIEAVDEAGEEFGTKRLEAILIRQRSRGIDGLLAEVEKAVRDHRGSAEATDDATLMVLTIASLASARQS